MAYRLSEKNRPEVFFLAGGVDSPRHPAVHIHQISMGLLSCKHPLLMSSQWLNLPYVLFRFNWILFGSMVGYPVMKNTLRRHYFLPRKPAKHTEVSTHVFNKKKVIINNPLCFPKILLEQFDFSSQSTVLSWILLEHFDFSSILIELCWIQFS